MNDSTDKLTRHSLLLDHGTVMITRYECALYDSMSALVNIERSSQSQKSNFIAYIRQNTVIVVIDWRYDPRVGNIVCGLTNQGKIGWFYQAIAEPILLMLSDDNLKVVF